MLFHCFSNFLIDNCSKTVLTSPPSPPKARCLHVLRVMAVIVMLRVCWERMYMMVVVSLIQDTHVINRCIQSPCRSLLALPTCGGLQRAHASPQLLLHDARRRMFGNSLFVLASACTWICIYLAPAPGQIKTPWPPLWQESKPRKKNEAKKTKKGTAP